MHHRPHRPAGRGVQHPHRNLLVANDFDIDENAARKPLRRPLNYLVDAHRFAGPWMPSIGNHGVVSERGTVGVLS
jgi:hypothetical protein